MSIVGNESFFNESDFTNVNNVNDVGHNNVAGHKNGLCLKNSTFQKKKLQNVENSWTNQTLMEIILGQVVICNLCGCLTTPVVFNKWVANTFWVAKTCVKVMKLWLMGHQIVYHSV